MKTLLLILAIMSMGISPRIDYSESFYKSVAASTTECSTGSVIADGKDIAVHLIRLNGAIDAHVMIVFDKDGAGEKIFSSTSGDINITIDTSDTNSQMTGDGVKKLQVCVINDKTVPSPIIGGAYESVYIK